MPGNIDTGLDGDDEAGGEDSSAHWLTVGASWMSRPTPCPVPCSKRSAQPASAMIARQTSSTSLAAMPGPHRGGAGRLRRPHDVEDAGQLALGLGVDAERARHVGAVALEGGAEVDHHRVAPRDAAARRGGGAAWPSSRRRPRSSRRRCSRRRRGAWPCRAPGRSAPRSRPRLMSGQHLEQRGVGDGGGPLHAGDLRRVLDLAQRLDRVRGGDQLGRRSAGRPRPRWPLQVTLSASSPMRAGAGAVERGQRRLALLGHRRRWRSRPGGRAGPLDLLGRLGAVAAVGGEQGARRAVTTRTPAEPVNPVR